MTANEKPEVTIPPDQPPSYQLEIEDITVGEGEEAVVGRIAATRSSSSSARAR
jgi:peptidylprolyl isomerase